MTANDILTNALNLLESIGYPVDSIGDFATHARPDGWRFSWNVEDCHPLDVLHLWYVDFDADGNPEEVSSDLGNQYFQRRTINVYTQSGRIAGTITMAS